MVVSWMLTSIACQLSVEIDDGERQQAASHLTYYTISDATLARMEHTASRYVLSAAAMSGASPSAWTVR